MENSKGIEAAAGAVRSRTGGEDFALAVVLGSGLGTLVERLSGAVSFPYREFSCFPATAVAGHAGCLVTGSCEGRRVLFFQGRYHLYEGYSARQVTLPIRLARQLGCRGVLLTNAVGGIHRDFRVGDFMFIADHINLMGDNPLRGTLSNPFLDLSTLYRTDLFPPLADYAAARQIGLHQGVLAALPGPSYETPAEIRALRTLGADAVSMSTVPEAIMAKYLGMDVAGLSLIANAAAGLSPAALTHQEVLATGHQGAECLWALVRHLVTLWGPRATDSP